VGAWKEQNWLIFCGCSWVEIAGMQSMSESVVVRRNIFFVMNVRGFLEVKWVIFFLLFFIAVC